MPPTSESHVLILQELRRPYTVAYFRTEVNHPLARFDMWTSNRFREGGIVALMFTKRQLEGRGGYWVLAPSGNCWREVVQHRLATIGAGQVLGLEACHVRAPKLP